jgi:hypothetical protein
VQIPDGPNGMPTLSPTQLRRYGAGGFRVDEHEDDRGCPRQYKARYVERRVVEDRAPALAYGSMVHSLLFALEDDPTVDVNDLLERFWPVDLDPSFWDEARNDVLGYLERGASPVDRMATVATEAELTALLYEDDDFGPIYMRGFVDWLGIDPEQPQTMHVVDYKTNRRPPQVEDVRGDVQLKTYDWLVRKNWSTWFPTSHRPSVVVHLDAIKFREVEVRYADIEIENWEHWAIAVARKILRDETAEPVLNPGCAWCPVRGDCPAFLALPETATNLLAIQPPKDGTAAEALWQWRQTANSVRLLLEKQVKQIDEAVATQAMLTGSVVIGETEWYRTDDWSTEIDVRSLHRAMSDAFYDVVTTSKTKIEEKTSDWEPHAVAAVRQCIERIPAGTKIAKRKVSDGA